VRVATRGSALARAQAELAIAALRSSGVGELTEVVVATTGDRYPEVPLDRLEGQGWFAAELERALLDGRAEIAVHSAKDLPTSVASGLVVAAHLKRADPRDAAVTRDGRPLAELAQGARVGTSSLRRQALVHELAPHVQTVPVRGNVDTRLRKLDAGDVDALVVACAGLDRLGLGGRAERLDPEVFVPAPAQGVIALEAVSGSPSAIRCAAIEDPEAAATTAAERAVLAGLGGGCLLPLGAWARVDHGRLRLVAALAGEDGVRRVEVSGHPAAPAELGARAVEQLR